MTDFLIGLLQRNRSAAPMVRPRLGSLFEPAPLMGEASAQPPSLPWAPAPPTPSALPTPEGESHPRPGSLALTQTTPPPSAPSPTTPPSAPIPPRPREVTPPGEDAPGPMPKAARRSISPLPSGEKARPGSPRPAQAPPSPQRPVPALGAPTPPIATPPAQEPGRDHPLPAWPEPPSTIAPLGSGDASLRPAWPGASASPSVWEGEAPSRLGSANPPASPSQGRPAPVTRPRTPPAQPIQPARPLPSAPPREATQPPVIRVSIGRIEVRAQLPERLEPPQPPAPSRPQPRRAPALSLSDYLKQRGGRP